MRQGLAALLAEETDLIVVGEAADGFEAIELAARLRPDVVLMDCVMPECDGIEATRVLRARWPQLRIIAVSVDAAGAAAMLRVGAETAVGKADVSEVLIEKIRAAPRRAVSSALAKPPTAHPYPLGRCSDSP